MLRNHRPVTGLEAKFSMEFAMASALVARDAGLRQLTDEFVRRPDVQETMTRVSIATTDSAAPDDLAFGFADQVRLRLADGTPLESPEVRYARGHWTRPLGEGELWKKFAECTERAMRSDAAAALFERLQRLDRLASVDELRRAGG
jgi:2-methylcitrate dehydratase PrpD